MNDILAEVKQEVQREQILAFFNKFWPHIVGAVVVVVIVFAGGIGWKSYQTRQAEIATEHLDALAKFLDEDKLEDAHVERQLLAETGAQNLITIGNLLTARAFIDASKLEEAKAIYDTVGKSKSSILITDFAKMMSAMVSLGASPSIALPEMPEITTDQPNVTASIATSPEAVKTDVVALTPEVTPELLANLKDISAEGRPWRLSALELLGVAYIQQKDYPAAQKVFLELSQIADLPPSILERSENFLIWLADTMAESVVQVTPTPSPAQE